MIRHVCLLYIGSVQRDEIQILLLFKGGNFLAIEAGGSETSNVTDFSDIKTTYTSNQIFIVFPNIICLP